MSTECLTGTNIPTLSEAPCDGIYLSDSCVVHAGAITALSLPINSSLETVINTLVLAIIYKQEQILDLQAQIDALTS